MRYTPSSLLAVLTILAVGPLGTARAETDSLTVENTIALVIQNHPAIHQAQQFVEASRAGVGQSRSSYYPQVSGNATYARIGPVPTVDIPGDGSFAELPENNWNFFLGASQLVYDFGRRRAGVALAQSGTQSSLDNEQFVKSQLAYAAVNVFYSILYLQQDIIVIDDQIANLNQLMSITEEKVKTGSATDFDVLTTRVRVAAAQTRKIGIEAQLKNQVTMLRQLTGLPANRELAFQGSFSAPVISPRGDSALQAAMEQRPDLKLARDAETTAGLEHQLATRGRWPTLNLNLQLGFKNGYFPDLNELIGNFTAGASIGVPVFTGFRTQYRERQALAGLNASRAHISDIERKITSDVRQALENLQASGDKISMADVQVKQAEQALDMAKVRYEAGVITNLDLLDAQTSLSEAQLVYIGAQYSYVISRYALDQATGKVVW